MDHRPNQDLQIDSDVVEDRPSFDEDEDALTDRDFGSDEDEADRRRDPLRRP
jgi:hypothetical protein